MSSHTPGPWGWFGSQHGFYLATIHGGRKYVMDFVRMGMHGAQPRFQPNCGMVNASELCQFEVGTNGTVGMTAAKADDTIYRYDIQGIDCADARLIAAAPELLEACKALLMLSMATDCTAQNMIAKAREAVAKAEGLNQ